jgi:hypothetical protein
LRRAARKPYAIGHDELNADEAVQEEVRSVARALIDGIGLARAGKGLRLRHDLPAPRDKSSAIATCSA